MLPAPGSPTYLPALLAHIQTEIRAGGDEWVIDPALLSTLLLSQIAGPKNGGIIVDVLPSESGMRGSRIEKVVNTVQAVSYHYVDRLDQAQTLVIGRYLRARDSSYPPYSPYPSL